MLLVFWLPEARSFRRHVHLNFLEEETRGLDNVDQFFGIGFFGSRVCVKICVGEFPFYSESCAVCRFCSGGRLYLFCFFLSDTGWKGRRDFRVRSDYWSGFRMAAVCGAMERR